MILIDAHVHIYDLFDLELFFESALKNFSRQAEAMPHQGDVSCFLLLSETPECNAFAELSELIGEEGNTPWRLTEVEPGLCLLLEHGLWPGLYLYIVAGRQLVVEEGLEIAALFTGAEFENRLSFGETFAAITETGGIAVCPWGVGKWLGERGRILREMILRYPKLYLGDSGGRPAIWRKPSFLEDSATGKPVLSGTDPLQISGEERRVGSFGCLLAGGVDKRRPASSLREIIRGGAVVMSYGKNMPFGEFIRLQWLIRKVKKVRDPKVLAAILEAEERAEELGFTETADIETASSDYASRFSGVAGKYFLTKQADYLLDLLHDIPEGSTILDVGGGHAQLAGILAENNFRITVTGSDKFCRKRVDRLKNGSQIQFKVCDTLNLPFSDKAFDVVIAFRLLPHTEDWQALLKEMCRVAKECVILDYPDRRSANILTDHLFGMKKKMEGNTRPYTLFSREEIAAEMGKNDFTLPDFRPQFFFPMVVHRKLQNRSLSTIFEGPFATLGLTRALGSPIIFRSNRNLARLPLNVDGNEDGEAKGVIEL